MLFMYFNTKQNLQIVIFYKSQGGKTSLYFRFKDISLIKSDEITSYLKNLFDSKKEEIFMTVNIFHGDDLLSFFVIA